MFVLNISTNLFSLDIFKNPIEKFRFSSWPLLIVGFLVYLQVEDLARLSFQTTPVYVDVDDGRTKVSIGGYLSNVM